MKKKIVFFLVVVLSFSLFSSEIIFASENTTERDYVESIDINESYYRVVSEEEVILDFMEKENVDRNTAIKELGINEDNNNELSSCTTRWRHYTSSKKVVDNTSKVSLSLSPYVQVRTCSGNTTFIGVSSAQPGYSFHGIFQNSGNITTASAVRTSSYRVNVHASGYIKPILGSNRYFNYENCVRTSGGCF